MRHHHAILHATGNDHTAIFGRNASTFNGAAAIQPRRASFARRNSSLLTSFTGGRGFAAAARIYLDRPLEVALAELQWGRGWFSRGEERAYQWLLRRIQLQWGRGIDRGNRKGCFPPPLEYDDLENYVNCFAVYRIYFLQRAVCGIRIYRQIAARAEMNDFLPTLESVAERVRTLGRRYQYGDELYSDLCRECVERPERFPWCKDWCTWALIRKAHELMVDELRRRWRGGRRSECTCTTSSIADRRSPTTHSRNFGMSSI